MGLSTVGWMVRM